ncbi:rCG55335 [Rattus norvegicus]|uniref:RCG55335 n=1 Tax=Rattus norvegicus TaxID=10116 RepID=A6KF11_RAT|nr:rCG55335 [Rattus norvegicus]
MWKLIGIIKQIIRTVEKSIFFPKHSCLNYCCVNSGMVKSQRKGKRERKREEEVIIMFD